LYELTGSYQLLQVYSSSRSFMPFSRGQLASDANSSQEESLSIRCLHFLQGETVDQTLTQFSQGD